MKIELMKQLENKKILHSKMQVSGGLVLIEKDGKTMIIPLQEISGIRNQEHFEEMEKEDKEIAIKFFAKTVKKIIKALESLE